MSMGVIQKEAGRAAFGSDPAAYDEARPDYPEWVFDILRSRCGLRDGTSTFEIGAGTGKATRRLLASGASPLLAIEPDARLARYLRDHGGSPALRVVNSAFEDTELESFSFDLGTSATAFHWLDEPTALARIVDALRIGGWWAPFWNTFGDPSREDPFHEATIELLSDGPVSPASSGSSRIEFGADTAERVAALRATGAFEMIDFEARDWSIQLNPDQVMQLYSTYSNVVLRPDRERVVAEIGRIARDEFGGRVTRNMTTALYVARRSG